MTVFSPIDNARRVRQDRMVRDIKRSGAQCAQEPIRVPGAIQPHGMLLVADPAQDLALVAASENAVRLIPPGQDLLAVTLEGLLGADFVAGLSEQLSSGLPLPSTSWETMWDHDGFTYEVSCHRHAGLVLIELMAAEAADVATALTATRTLQRAVAELRGHESDLDALSRSIVRSIRRLTGYERVLVYRFDADWNGQAIAEDMVEGWPQPLLGLHFPESDIPAQARELYRTSLMRWTMSSNVDAVPVRRTPGWGQPIDLSYAHLRSLSPLHMQYHRNLGVDGAMSISIMDGPRLWGLVVCHHRGPHRTTGAERTAAMALTDAFGLRIRPAELASAEVARQAEQVRYQALVSHITDVDDLSAALTGGRTMLELFDVPGAAVVLGGTLSVMGETPDPAKVTELAVWLRGQPAEGAVYATASLSAEMPDWSGTAAASGVLAVFLDAARSDILMWFRPEEPMTVTWGGNPTKGAAADGSVLPRQSFDRWVEERRGMARPWAPHELEIAGLLRHSITDVILRNVRRYAALNEQLRQSQKMEAVGQLTGGLAHDFNNLLGGITSSLELARMRLAQGRAGDLDRYLAAALGSAGRAASLTNRLLSFSRRQTLDPRPVDANRLIRSMEELIRRTMGPSIEVEVVVAAGLWTILCDGNQLESALLNLSLNARDAMEAGGRLTIEVTNARMDEAVARSYDVPPGHYVALSVTDTGRGMSSEVVNRVFEPFYTTKPLGQGTGLGLSMVYGFAKQSGGQTRIYSEPGLGTTVRLYMPRHLGPAEQGEENPDSRHANRQGARVLVLDDEPVLRAMVSEALSEDGHSVTEAADGKQALALLDRSGPFELLVTDVGLPGGMNGRQVAEAARRTRPDLRVLFMTGYAENAALSGGLLGPTTQVLTKPFGLRALVDKVRHMVDGTR